MIELFYRLRPFILLVGLLTISLVVMANINHSLMWSVRAQTLKLVGAIEYRMNWATEILLSINENQELRSANLKLTTELARLRIAGQQNEQLRRALGWQQMYEFETLAARIIAREPYGATNFLTLNVGSDQGVEVNMAVISHKGILGRIVHVSSGYSQVMPYLHSQFHVPAMIDTLGSIGIVSGKDSTPDSLIFHDVVKTVPVQKGQRVITHEASEIFPPNIPIGTIAGFQTQPGGNFWTIKLRPASPLHTTHFAFIILRRAERTDSIPDFPPIN
ncbi:MAG: rod shape-determining protein MreC [Bacteroidetes bacterium]|nr:rod shape-determining protein MreC [Bacteroidota bacterium]MCY4205655.1 rod shape-determining protein MreC [Bacteroidota bacterium]